MQFKRLKFLVGFLVAIFFIALSGCQSDSKVPQPRQVDYDLGKYLSSIPREFPEQREYHASDGSLQAFTGYRRGGKQRIALILSLIHISEPTRPPVASRMPSSA